MPIMPMPPDLRGDDTAGITYDVETAVHFAHKATGIDLETCWKFFMSASRYDLGMGFVSPISDDEALEIYEATPSALRKQYPVCFPPALIEGRCLEAPLKRLFIALETGLDERTVRCLYDAEDEYMDRLGLFVRVRLDDGGDGGDEVVNPVKPAPPPDPSGRSFLLTEWVTVRGASFSTPWVQDAETWLDPADFSDADLWNDISDVPDPTCRKKD